MKKLKVPKKVRRVPGITRIDELNAVDFASFDPPWWVPRHRWENQLDPELRRDLLEQLEIQRKALTIAYSAKKNELFEDLMKIIFPHPDEMFLRHVAIWLIRDGLSRSEICARLDCSPQKAGSVISLAEKRVQDYVQRYGYRSGILEPEDVLSEEDRQRKEIEDIIRG